MSRHAIEISINAEDHRIARLAAIAVALSLVDAAIPSPLPGVKPGLANIVTLLVLSRYGWGTAVWVTLLRVLAGSILLGQFLAPGFFLSLSGALCSLLVLACVPYLPTHFGIVSWSILAAFAHTAGQLLIARLWLIPSDGIFYLLPIFLLAALIFGTINGIICARCLLSEAPTEKTEG